MSPGKPRNLSASVRQKLLNLSKAKGDEFQNVLTRYALERLLYRLHLSEYSDRFILKGAMLFVVWSGEPHRATKDLDLLCFGEYSVSHLATLFQAICNTPAEEDGLTFQAETVKGIEIKEAQEYPGVRVTLQAILTGTSTRIPIQVDIGFGDVVYPRPERIQYPVILSDFAAPMLRVYSRETVVAEKYQAMVNLGIANSRMKDFYDLWYLTNHHQFAGRVLSQAIQATFERRKTILSPDPPLALTAEFYQDATKQKQWLALIRKGKVKETRGELEEVVLHLQQFLLPPT